MCIWSLSLIFLKPKTSSSFLNLLPVVSFNLKYKTSLSYHHHVLLQRHVPSRCYSVTVAVVIIDTNAQNAPFNVEWPVLLKPIATKLLGCNTISFDLNLNSCLRRYTTCKIQKTINHQTISLNTSNSDINPKIIIMFTFHNSKGINPSDIKILGNQPIAEMT